MCAHIILPTIYSPSNGSKERETHLEKRSKTIESDPLYTVRKKWTNENDMLDKNVTVLWKYKYLWIYLHNELNFPDHHR